MANTDTLLQGVAIWQLFSGVDFFSPLTISLLWAIYNAIPPFLILFYAAVGRVRTAPEHYGCCLAAALMSILQSSSLPCCDGALWRWSLCTDLAV